MIKKNFFLNVISINNTIYSDFIKKIIVTGIEGELGIFAGHSQLLTLLKPSFLHIVDIYESNIYIYISGGFIEVKPKKIVILVNKAIYVNKLNKLNILKKKKKMKKKFLNIHIKI